jgi:4-amino-4-deoxy-L-arabinose transferase-like glycosyltransferase
VSDNLGNGTVKDSGLISRHAPVVGVWLSRLSEPPAINILSAAIIIIFFILGLARAYPFIDDVTPELAAGDDWLTYKQQALSILHDGWTMPLVSGNYVGPRGFLYNYFLAAMYATIGDNSSFIYVVQATMLGASIPTMYYAFRKYLSPAVGVAYLLGLSALLYVDVFLFYSRRLLSENLLIFLLPLFFLLLIRAYETQTVRYCFLTGILMGLMILTRPNFILVAPVVAFILFLYSKSHNAKRIACALIFIATICLVVSFMAMRNYAVTREISMPSFTTRYDWETPHLRLEPPLTAAKLARASKDFLTHYTKRVLYCVGFPSLLKETRFPVVPHWPLIWLGVIVFIAFSLRRRRMLFWETAVVAFIFTYLVPLIAVAPLTYGVRLIVPIDPALLLLCFRTLDILSRRQTPA